MSAIIVTYNHERYIAEAIESVLSQRTQFGFELIISEDCSTDATRRIVQEYADKAPDRIRLMLSEKNLCSNMVTERAIAAARGDYIAFVDGDDYFASPDKLQRQADFLDAHPDYAMCYHNALNIKENGERMLAPYVKPQSPRLHDLASILAANPIPGSSPMIRRTALSAFPDWFEDAPFGDWALYIVAAQHGLIGYIDEPLSVYRRHAQSQWSSLSLPAQYRGFLNFYDYLIARMPAEFTDRLRAIRETYRTHTSYVAHDGKEFLALYEAGKIYPDACCTRNLKLRVQALEPADGVKVVMANPPFDPRFSRNRIEVQVDDKVQTRTGLAPGEPFELEFPRLLAAGETFGFEARSSLAFGVDGKVPPRFGFRLLRFEPLGRPG